MTASVYVPPRLQTAFVRELPQNLEAEESVLGAMMMTTGAVEESLALLKPEHFFRDTHGLIFGAMRQLYQEDVTVDAITLWRKLEEQHTDEAVGGKSRIHELANLVPAASNVKHYAALVLDAWGKRECIRAFTEPMRGAWNGSTPYKVLREVESACMTLHGLVEADDQSRTVVALDAASALHERVNGGGDPPGVVAPFSFLNDMVKGGLYVLGGYAKDGKTAVAVQAARKAAERGLRVGFVSIEMPERKLTEKLVATYGVPYGPLSSGIVAPDFRGRFDEALKQVAQLPLTIHDDPATDVADVARYQRLGHYDFLIVDHLHQMAYEDTKDPRQRLSSNVKALARLARTAGVPILLLAQFHRSIGTDSFPRPTMQSFKETGTIEQIATALWAVWRKRDKDTGRRLADTEFLVLADRYGEDAAEAMWFNGDQQSFMEVDTWRQ